MLSWSPFSTQESLLIEKLKVELKQMELEKSQLEEKLRTIEDSSSTEGEEKSSSLSEERLRWQMEKENLRKELMAKMDAEREPILKEKEALENKLRLIEEAGPTLTREQVTALEHNLSQSQTRWGDSIVKLPQMLLQRSSLVLPASQCCTWKVSSTYIVWHWKLVRAWVRGYQRECVTLIIG